MPPFDSLPALLAHLRQGDVVPRPEGEPWPEMIRRITVPGAVHEIDEETWTWFLECLPPHWMGGGAFVFAEGAEPLRLFARAGRRHVVRQLAWEETQVFCALAHFPLPH